MKKSIFICLFLSISTFFGYGQGKILNLPDIPGFVTIKCDLHMHTMLSDGDVWPTVRVDEAVRDGLDAIAISDHLEYNPHKDLVPLDHNAAWKTCEEYAKTRNLILVHGAELTRKMPPGHFNALFIKDGSLLTHDSVWDNFEEAIKQGAFLQWNHPGWKNQEADGIPKLYDIHKKLMKNGWLHGIEIYNDADFYPQVYSFIEGNHIALMGNSDIHAVISERYNNTHRPMTLVFAKERSHDSLKEALMAGRTIVYYNNNIAGREEYARPFFNECVKVGKPYYKDSENIYFAIRNTSDIPFYLINGENGIPAELTLAPNSVTTISISRKVSSPLVYDVKNVITGENKVLRAELKY